MVINTKYLPSGYSGKAVNVTFSSGFVYGTGEQLRGGTYAIPESQFKDWTRGKSLNDYSASFGGSYNPETQSIITRPKTSETQYGTKPQSGGSPTVTGSEYSLGGMKVSTDVYEKFIRDVKKEGRTFEVSGKEVTPEQFFRAKQFKEQPYNKVPRFTQSEVNKMDLLDIDTGQIVGTSMQQTIPNKSYMVSEKIEDASNIPIGTIIRYKNPDEPLGYTIHRIIGRKDGNYIVLGDNNVANELIRPEDITHTLKGIIKSGRTSTIEPTGSITKPSSGSVGVLKETKVSPFQIFKGKVLGFFDINVGGSKVSRIRENIFGSTKDVGLQTSKTLKGETIIKSNEPVSIIKPTTITSSQLLRSDVRTWLSPSTSWTETVTTTPDILTKTTKVIGEDVGKVIVGEGKVIDITPNRVYAMPSQQGTTIMGGLGQSNTGLIIPTSPIEKQTVTVTPETFGEVANVGSYFLPYVGQTRFFTDVASAGTKVATGQKTTFGEKASLIGAGAYGVYKLGQPSWNYFVTTKVRPVIDARNEVNLVGFTGSVVEKAPTETESIFFAKYNVKASSKGKTYDRTIFGDIVVPTNQPAEDKVISGSKFRIFEKVEGGEPETEPLLRSSAITTSKGLPPPASEDIFFSSSRIVTSKPSGEKIFTKAEGLTTKGVRPDIGNNLRIVSGETSEGKNIEFFTGLGISKDIKMFKVTQPKDTIFGKLLGNIIKPVKDVKTIPSQLEEGKTFSLGFTKLTRYQEPQESIFGNIFMDLVTRKKVKLSPLSPEEVKSLIEPTIKDTFKIKPIKVSKGSVTVGYTTTRQGYNPLDYQYQETGGLSPPFTISQNALFISPKQEVRQEQKNIPKLDLIGIQKEGQKQRQGSGIVGIQSTGQQQKQELKQIQKQRQQEIQKLQQRSIQNLKSVLLFDQPIPRVKSLPKLKTLPILSSTQKIKSLLGKISTEKGYQTYVKRFGKFTPVGKVTTKGEAIKLGVKATKSSLAATFKVTPTNRQITKLKDLMGYEPPKKEFRGYRVIKGVKVPLEETWIQKAPFRLSSKQERREIKQAKKSNIFKKGGRFKW